MAEKLTGLTHKIATQLHHFQFSRQAINPEIFRHTLVGKK